MLHPQYFPAIQRVLSPCGKSTAAPEGHSSAPRHGRRAPSTAIRPSVLRGPPPPGPSLPSVSIDKGATAPPVDSLRGPGGDSAFPFSRPPQPLCLPKGSPGLSSPRWSLSVWASPTGTRLTPVTPCQPRPTSLGIRLAHGSFQAALSCTKGISVRTPSLPRCR
ncbi:hypothetical protein NDU88_005150 [Pleurodeles waltl]|uniref:Uncharacterized protein n=1 Tax=Pleurodeles waltl TaxID=8319 RepID=A0AAV7QI56_PLEWA|nr:hypothetical protein NDU88_005150 [Pleurodeles waltl]